MQDVSKIQKDSERFDVERKSESDTHYEQIILTDKFKNQTHTYQLLNYNSGMFEKINLSSVPAIQ